jgi:hypothetical protein
MSEVLDLPPGQDDAQALRIVPCAYRRRLALHDHCNAGNPIVDHQEGRRRGAARGKWPAAGGVSERQEPTHVQPGTWPKVIVVEAQRVLWRICAIGRRSRNHRERMTTIRVVGLWDLSRASSRSRRPCHVGWVWHPRLSQLHPALLIDSRFSAGPSTRKKTEVATAHLATAALGVVVLGAAFFFGADFLVALGAALVAFLGAAFFGAAFLVLFAAFVVVFLVAIVSNPQQVGTSATDIQLPVTLKVLSEIYGARKGEIGSIFEISRDFESERTTFLLSYARFVDCAVAMTLRILDLGNPI